MTFRVNLMTFNSRKLKYLLHLGLRNSLTSKSKCHHHELLIYENNNHYIAYSISLFGATV